jgi:hypothetical protein
MMKGGYSGYLDRITLTKVSRPMSCFAEDEDDEKTMSEKHRRKQETLSVEYCDHTASMSAKWLEEAFSFCSDISDRNRGKA